MTRGVVIEHFLRNWDYAQRTASISKPFSWALLETWKWVDKREEEREVVEDGCNN